MKANKNIDILKYVMSIMIILIHVGYAIDIPVLRVAVPIFFIISSYIFFKKTNQLDESEADAYYKKFLIRTCKLYLFWFIVCLPYIVLEQLYHHTLADFITYLPLNILFRSTFPASWYLAALVVGISFVYKTKRYIGLQVFVGIITYIICCLESNYANLLFAAIDRLISSNHEDFKLLIIYVLKFPAYLSFPAGILYIAIGKLLNIYRGWCHFAIPCILIGSICLFIENHFITLYNWRTANDCFFSFIILAPSIFLFIKDLPTYISINTVPLRNMSTIYYCSHMSILGIVHFGCNILSIEIPKPLTFLIVLILCTILSIILIFLAKFPRFRILNYSY